MIGRETDIIVIDLKEAKAYNLGYTAYAENVTELLNTLMPNTTKEARAKRFLVIDGIELGINKKLKHQKRTSLYNPKVLRKSASIASY